jgi:hypothetical protein
MQGWPDQTTVCQDLPQEQVPPLQSDDGVTPCFWCAKANPSGIGCSTFTAAFRAFEKALSVTMRMPCRAFS